MKLAALSVLTPPPTPPLEPSKTPPTGPLSQEEFEQAIEDILTVAKPEEVDKTVEEQVAKTNNSEQKQKIQQNAEYKKVAIKLVKDSTTGAKGKELAQNLTTNLEKLEKLEKELEKFTEAQDKNSSEYKIFSNSEYKEAIQTKLAEVRKLKSKLKRQLETEESSNPTEINYPL
jgi:hypothetical protein